MRKILTFVIIGCLCVGNAFATDIATPVKKVLISQLVDHPALNMTTRGIIEGLAEAGYERGKNLELRVESAQANSVIAAQIANKFVHQQPDVVVGVATIAAQSFVKYAAANKVKLIFSSVTDPVAANLVTTLQLPGNNTSGVSNFISLKPQLQLFKELQPKLQRIGFLYNPGEINSISLVKQLDPICNALNLILIKQAVAKSADVPQTAAKLAAQVDAIFISNDSTALSSLQSIIKAAQAAKIPVYVSDTDSVELGAVAALGPNQVQIGKQTAQMIVKVLNGADLNTLPVEFPLNTELYINLEAAAKAGIEIPSNVLERATRIVEKSKS